VKIARQLAAILCAGLVVFGSTAIADTEACQEAIDQFKSARSDVDSDLTSYASCVSDSDGHDDCSSEFSTVQSAQSDFESAVSSYESDCE